MLFPLEQTTAFAVANWFIQKSIDTQLPITHLKLQKLVYFAYGWYYAYYGAPLFGETISAWQHGPVVDSLYGVFQTCKKKPINCLVMERIDENGDGRLIERAYSIGMDSNAMQKLNNDDRAIRVQFEKNAIDLLEIVWDAYSKYDAFQLTNITHRPGTPWRDLYDYFNGHISRCPISPKEIQRYFQNLIKQYQTTG